MNWSGNISIRRKLTLIIIGITSTTLIAGFIFLLIGSVSNMEKNLRTTSVKNAELMAVYSIIPLTFNDYDQAIKNLSPLKAFPSIHKAIVYDQDNELFAVYEKDSSIAVPEISFHEKHLSQETNHLHVFRPIIHNGQNLGTIYLIVSTEFLDQEIRNYIIVFLIILMVMILIAVFLSVVFQKSITAPIINLAGLMERVTNKEDYSIRIKKEFNNEIGILYSGFNSMLEKIEEEQRLLKRSEEQFRTIYNSVNDAIFIHDIDDGTIIDVNLRMLQIYGYDNKQDLIGRDIGFLSSGVEPYTLENALRWMLKAKEHSAGRVFEWQGKAKNGRVFWVEISFNKVILLGIERILVLIRDISERKDAEIELKKTKNYIDNIINSMPSFLIGIDSDNRVIQWNKQAEIDTGIPVADAIGKIITDIVPRFASEMDKINTAIQEGKVVSDSLKARKEGNEIKYENITVYPLLGDDSGGAVIRIDNVTDQKRMEEMMIQSEKMLSVGGLAAGMAHEINNPLAGILASIEVIKLKLNDKEKNRLLAENCSTNLAAVRDFFEQSRINKKLSTIHELVVRASKIVQDMLNFSRKSESKFLYADITQTLDKTVSLAGKDYNLKKKYDFRQIEIIREYESDLPEIKFQESKIQQVFLNILKNGAEAMFDYRNDPENSSNINSKIILRAKNLGGKIRIEIEDNGPGISPDIIQHVFEPFFTTKDVGVGTGLGLSVSYFIITEHHAGEMSVESRKGKGTTFIIELPVS